MAATSILGTDSVQADAFMKWGASGEGRSNIHYAAYGLRSAGHLYAHAVTLASSQTIDESVYNGTAYLVSASGAARTITFEAAATVTDKVIFVKKTDSSVKTVTLDFNSAETGDGNANIVLYDQYECVAVLCDGTGWHILAHFRPAPLERVIADPGNAGAIPITRSGHVALVTAGAETRTLAAPTVAGRELLLYCKTYVGNCVVTCATTVNETGNNTITFSATGQSLKLTAVEEGSNFRWRLAQADGAALSTV
jgi:hypothetical protein